MKLPKASALSSGIAVSIAALVALAAPFLPTAVSADQAWPTRPVKFILTLGPGSGADIGARLFADRLSQRWGQPIVVENRPGGDGIVAINSFVSAHDDHQLLFSPTSSFTAHPFLHDHLPYKPADLLPIARVSNTIITISTPASLNVNSLTQLMALARAQPGKLNWAGVTGALDFIFAGWLKREGLDIAKIAYKNPVDAANDLAEGRVQVYESALAIIRPQLQTGKVKLLCVTNTVRAPTEPDLPTAQEAGQPALTIDGLVGLFGPTGMPLALRQRIAAEIRAVADDTIKQRLVTTGQLLNVGGPEDFAKSIDEQRAQVAAFAKELGVAELPQD
ncbi:MAG TPA: tripartite tricarboxylate transporter substrate binding protein [Xanthobacteraceae bacterium]|jgi:tripartite-type tricarboxylate transporter receptor subunit TctC|nr:tripartite tricarboxylate transporter substrate binding protein [Xanthobacteraceae bacterium]